MRAALLGYVTTASSVCAVLRDPSNVLKAGARIRAVLRSSPSAELLDLVGLGEFADNYPHELSGGSSRPCAGPPVDGW